MRIFLVRHGEAKRSGKKDFGLTEQGVDQIQRLARHLPRVDRVVTSTLPRAVKTGEIICSLTRHEMAVAMLDLCEISEKPECSDESLDQFLERVSRVMLELTEMDCDSMLVVTHAGFIMASIRALFDIPTPGTGARLEPVHGSITEWSRGEGVWELCSYNLTPGSYD